MSLETFDCRLASIRFHKASKYNPSGTPFMIAQTTMGAIIKGEMRKPIVGESYRLYGEWKAQKGYKEPAFEFSSHEAVIDQSVDGVTQYLASHIMGLGPVKSRALVETFGDQTLAILRSTPERAAEVSMPGSGITTEIIEAIRKHFAEATIFDPVAHARLIDLFAGHRVPKSVIKLLLRDWQSDAPAKVLETPYMLLAYPRLGWKIVDSFALTKAGYDPRGIDRHRGAILEGLERLAQQGHTYGAKIDVESIAYPLIEAVPSKAAWESAVGDGLVVKVPVILPIAEESWSELGRDDDYALPKLANAENEIARRLTVLADTARPLEFELSAEGLNEDQTAALSILQDNGVALLVGAPGVGKTWTITALITSLIANGVRSIRLVAPTGKAAKRAAELLEKKLADARDENGNAIEIPTTTIHRALSPKPSEAPEGVPSADAKINRGREEFAFGRNEGNPIEAEFLVVDESSMIDVSLGASLLKAVAPGTRVVIVGDANQLPSVGPGSVLRDLIDSGLPTATLTQVQRNAGRIVRACHAIKDGRVPEPAQSINLDPAVGDNWIHIELSDPVEIARRIVDLHKVYKAFPDPTWDLQVVTPQRSRLPIACDNLNRLLSEKLNKYGNILGEGPAVNEGAEASTETNEADAASMQPFRRGDKVVRTKNGLCDLMTEIKAKVPIKATVEAVEVTQQGTGAAGDLAHDFSSDDGTAFGTFPRGATDADLDPWLEAAMVVEDDAPRTDWRWDDRKWSLSETDVVNGDTGEILDVILDDDDSFVVVEFRTPRRLCRLPYASCHLVQAYALTAHKAQGSGFPYVIVPVHHSFYWDQKTGQGLFSREWLYTACSRAEKLLVTVGEFSAVRSAVGRKTVHRRKTRLAGLIRDARVRPIEGPTIEFDEADEEVAVAVAPAVAPEVATEGVTADVAFAID